MQNPRWPSLLYCLKCCSRDPLGKQRGGDGGTKQKYRKVQKNRELEPGTRERAESGRLLYLNQVKVTSSNTTDRACHCLHTTRRYRHKTEFVQSVLHQPWKHGKPSAILHNRLLIGPWWPAKAAFVRNYLEVYWPRTGGFSAVNAIIGTQLHDDPINSGLTRWRMAVTNE